jgi:protein transport protein SEC24
MDLMNQPGTISKASRKKARAYHELDQGPPEPVGMPGMGGGNLPPLTPGVADNLQQGFLSHNAPPAIGSPGSSQFPVPAAPNFAPQQPADPAAFHARPGSGSMGVSQTGGKIDPLSIPSIPAARDASVQHFRQTVFPTFMRHLPPNAISDFIAHDQGNASPRICRLTLNAVPATGELLTMTHLPLALMIQPLAKLKVEEEQVPVLDFGEMGPPRCRRCRTYINPFMQFVHGGSKFQCNMCLFPNNEVPSEYYAPTDMGGIRVDRDQRPELTRGTVEFVVPKEYWAKKDGAEVNADGKGGAPMTWLFLVDVTEGAVNRGSLAAVVDGIKETLYGESAYENVLPEEESEDGREGMKRRLPKGCKIGICTFDKEIHFYNLNVSADELHCEPCVANTIPEQPGLDQAQMVVVSDIEEPFVPFSEGLFVDPYESRYSRLATMAGVILMVLIGPTSSLY